jgi:hypothetical protein
MKMTTFGRLKQAQSDFELFKLFLPKLLFSGVNKLQDAAAQRIGLRNVLGLLHIGPKLAQAPVMGIATPHGTYFVGSKLGSQMGSRH